MINKYYIADLAPGRSMLEYAVKHGLQTFAISWRNPGEQQADWDLDTYATAVLEALDAVEEITGTDSTHVLGLCAGGIVLSTVVAHLAATGMQDRIAGLDARRHRARPAQRRDHRRLHGPEHRGCRDGGLRAQGLPQRPLAAQECSPGCARTT